MLGATNWGLFEQLIREPELSLQQRVLLGEFNGGDCLGIAWGVQWAQNAWAVEWGNA